MSTLSLMARLGLDGSGYSIGIKKAEGEAKRLSREFNGNVKGAIAGAFGAAALIAYEKRVIEFASHINDLSDQIGVSTDALQEWSYAAKQNGADIDDVTKFFEKLGESRAKALGNNQASIESFKRLGITLDDLKKKRLEDIGIGIGRTVLGGDPQSLGASIRDVGGRGATKLITTFKGDVEALSKAARDAGAVINNDTIQRLDDLGDAADNFAATLRGPMAEGLLATLSALNVMVVGVKAIGAYFGQAAAKSPTKLGQVMNVMEAMSPIQIILKQLFPKRAEGGTQKIEDQFEAFKKIFADAAEAEVQGKADRDAKRRLRQQSIPTGIESGSKSEKMNVNSLQQIGAYIGGANPMLQVAQRSEGHLRDIKAILKKPVIGGFDRSDDIYT